MSRFIVNGFQATGMADIISASGLSAGAVYRYFKSKDELIEAIVDRVIGEAERRFEDLLAKDAPPSPLEAVRVAADTLEDVSVEWPADVTRIAVQAWAEALRNDRIHAVVSGAYLTIRGYFVEVVRRSQAEGSGAVSPDADPDQVGAALFSLQLGFLLQRVLLGDVEAASYVDAVAALIGDSRDADGAVSGRGDSRAG